MSYAPLRDSFGDPPGLHETHHLNRADHHDEHYALHPSIPSHSSRRSPYFFTGDGLHTAISVAAGTVMCLFGYEQGVFGGIMVGAPFLAYFASPSPSLLGFVTSVYDLGCFAGAVISSFIGERLGRRWMLLVFTVIMTLGIAIQTGARDMRWLIWGRFVAGIGNGGNTATAPVWHVECSKAEEKGRAVVKEMTVNVGGFVLSNVITLVFSGSKTDMQWRFPLGIQLVFSVVILGMVWVLPESPRWLLLRHKDQEATRVLEALSESPEEVQVEFQKIKESVRIEQATKASWRQVFGGGVATRRVSLGVLLQMVRNSSPIIDSILTLSRLSNSVVSMSYATIYPSSSTARLDSQS
jgi:MFS family permease